MEVVVRHDVNYEVKGPVPVDEIIDTLIAQRRFISELPGLLEKLTDGVSIERAELRVQSIEISSLKEYFFVALFVAYQTELKTEIPAMIEDWFAVPVDDRYDTLVTIGVLLLIFYGADYAYKRFTDHLGSEQIKKKLDDLVAEFAHLSGKSEPEVRKIIEQYMDGKGRLKELGKAAIRFFKPSRNQKNDPIVIDGRRIETNVVSDVPNQVDVAKLDSEDHNVPIYGTRVELRAKDHDHDGSGWGGIVSTVSDIRKPVRLYPNVSKDLLWNEDVVSADVMVTYRTTSKGQEHVRYHIMQVYDERPSPTPSEA